MATTTTIHLVMRYPNNPALGLPSVEDYKTFAETNGSVWIAKPGYKLSKQHIDTINNQCREEIASNLHLITKSGTASELYSAKILRIASEVPEEEHQLTVQQQDLPQAEFWIKVSNVRKSRNEILASLRVASTGMPVNTVIGKSTSSVLIVR